MSETLQNDPLVSVVVITYNSSKYVLETLESIKGQTYQNIELVVSDDCSTDNTVALCDKWITENRGRFVSTILVVAPQNRGVASNCNAGLNPCNGEWIKFIAGDDAFEPYLISEYIKYASEHTKVEIICSNLREYKNTFEDKNAQPLESRAKYKIFQDDITPAEQFQMLLRVNMIATPTVMMKKEVVNKVGRFNEQFPFFEDRPLWLELTKGGYKFYYLDIISVKYRVHEQSVQINESTKYFQSRYQVSRDEAFLNKYCFFLSPIEKTMALVVIYKNRFIRRIFKNRLPPAAKFISQLFSYLPNEVLKRYKVKYK